MREPTQEELVITRRVGNRLSESLPPQGVMDWTDVQQFALEALLILIEKDELPETPAHMSVRIRSETIGLLREHGVFKRYDGHIIQPERATLDELPPWMKDALLTHDEEIADEVNERIRRRNYTTRVKKRSLLDQAYLGRAVLEGYLTEKELEVLALLADGHNYESGGKIMGISGDTFDTHAYRIYKKLGVKNKTKAVAVGFRRGLIS